MSQKVFSLTSASVFALIALAHLLRVALGGTFVVQGFPLPMWASGVAVAGAGFLAYQGLRLAVKPPPRT